METLTKTPATQERPMPILIKSKEAHRKALKRIGELMDLNPPAFSREGRELELLAHLVERYEKQNFGIGLPDPVSAIQFCLEQRGLHAGDLIPLLGSRSRVSEILSGKRQLTVAMIRRLNNALGIPFEVLIGQE